MGKEAPKAQNSSIRAAFSGITNGAARLLIEAIPGITADSVTHAGLGAVIAGSVVKILPKEMITSQAGSLVSLGLLSFGVICDAFDGAVARNTEKKSSNDPLHGSLTDVMSDRFGESAMTLSRIIVASARKDVFGVVAATVSGLTAPLPSLLRAIVEKQGFYVPESGGSPLSFLGTRGARVMLAIPATSYPEMQISGNNSQPIFDSLSALGNIAATIERFLINRKANKGLLKSNSDEEAKELGKAKVERLGKFTLINTVTLLTAGIIGLVTMSQT